VDPLILLFIGMGVVLGSILLLRMHAFLALLLAALVVGSLTTDAHLEEYAASLDPPLSPAATQTLLLQPLGERLALGFGRTCAGIGLLIAMASIIGKSLLEAGAAHRIVRTSVRILGEKRSSVAFLGSGYLLGIPVFFDTVFYLLIPLAKAMATRIERHYTLYLMCIVAGTTMTHSLVPPTPGPLFAADFLGVDLGTMILCGLAVGAITSFGGYLYAVWANRRWPTPIRGTPDISLAELRILATKKDDELPPFWLSVLPILLPVVLIAGSTVGGQVIDSGDLPGLARQLGDKNVALALGAAVALGMLWHQTRAGLRALAKSVENALLSAGTIILITGMGGAFGIMLQHTAIGPRIQDLMGGSHSWILPLAFFLTALIRTALGSATVAMFTAVPILAAFADPAVLGFHPVWLAMAIGCGSKPFPWMNDSGFWVICRMSGMTEAETLKTTSMTIAVEGLIGLPTVMVLSNLFPLI
jgi:gluconate:H+ symporter, GntP family